MAKPWIHSLSSVRKFGGRPEDYLDIHNFMDSSKAVMPDNRHRALTHNSWFLSVVLERVFGVTITNSDGKTVSVRDVGEQHIFEDLRFIPSGQDYLAELEYKPWMEGRGTPPSFEKIAKSQKTTTTEIRWDRD
jgi:hypothetical protein